MKVTLAQQTPSPINFIAEIASICYDSHPSDPKKFVKHLYERGHHSVMEHVYFTFKIEGISRACSHQLVRHRHASFTQRSQRYCTEDGFEYVTPPTVNLEEFISDMDEMQDMYDEHRRNGAANEDARYVLPNACCTSLYVSCNLRELMHICNERLCIRAQWEIRDLVYQMTRLVDPELSFMFVPRCGAPHLRCLEKCRRHYSIRERGFNAMEAK